MLDAKPSMLPFMEKMKIESEKLNIGVDSYRKVYFAAVIGSLSRLLPSHLDQIDAIISNISSSQGNMQNEFSPDQWKGDLRIGLDEIGETERSHPKFSIIINNALGHMGIEIQDNDSLELIYGIIINIPNELLLEN